MMPYGNRWFSTVMEASVYLVEHGFIVVCISSSVCPFVSGTSFATNRTVKPDMLANMKMSLIKSGVIEIGDFEIWF